MDVRWPDRKRPKKHLEDMLAHFPDLEFIVDATEQPIYRPKGKEAQKLYYSGKRKRHTIKTQLAVTPMGEIGDISESVPVPNTISHSSGNLSCWRDCPREWVAWEIRPIKVFKMTTLSVLSISPRRSLEGDLFLRRTKKLTGSLPG